MIPKKDRVTILSHKHNRFVFCSREEYQKRHIQTDIRVYYHELSKQGDILTKYLKLHVDGEGVLWEVVEIGNQD